MDGTVEWSHQRPSRFTVLERFLQPHVASSVRSRAAELTFDERPDSVDGAPAHELYVIKDGKTLQPTLADLTTPALRALKTHVASWPICRDNGGCTPCTSLIRRYRPHERRSHYEHVDGHASATAVVSLSLASEYRGGLYLSNLTHRRLLPLSVGDAILHRADLFHGVQVSGGERWSWVVWFRTCFHCTMGRSSEWYRSRAESGDPFGQFLHASRVGQGVRDERARRALAALWYNRSALGGFAPAMHALGNAYAAGDGVAADLRTVALWLERAVTSGGARAGGGAARATAAGGATVGGPRVGSRAAFDLARLLLRGVDMGWPSPLAAAADDPATRAAELLATAAADGHARAAQMVEAIEAATADAGAFGAPCAEASSVRDELQMR